MSEQMQMEVEETMSIRREVEVHANVSEEYCGVHPGQEKMIYLYCVEASSSDVERPWIVDARQLETTVAEFQALQSCEQTACKLGRMVHDIIDDCVYVKVTVKQRRDRESWSDSVVTYERKCVRPRAAKPSV